MIKDFFVDTSIQEFKLVGENLTILLDDEAPTYMIANGFRIEEENEYRIKIQFEGVSSYVSKGLIRCPSIVEDNSSHLLLKDDDGSIEFDYKKYTVKKIKTME